MSVPVALAMGKVALAMVMGLAGIGICVRLARHRRAAAGMAPDVPLGLRAGATAAAAVLAVAETVLLAEATGLPVRYGQPGFAPSNWAWVLAALAVLFWGQRKLLLELGPGSPQCGGRRGPLNSTSFLSDHIAWQPRNPRA